MNKYPNNSWCKRPKDSPMRQFCRCADCLKYKEWADGKIKKQQEIKGSTRTEQRGGG